MIKKLKNILFNRVVAYLLTRYLTFFVQFLSSIFLGVILGPYYFGIWGFINLIFSYLSYFNLGITNSLNILMIHDKNDESAIKKHVANSVVLISFLSLLFILFSIYYYIFGISSFNKYHVEKYLYIICLTAIIYHFNNLFGTIYRIKNKLFELAFSQSIIPLLIFVSLFFTNGEDLLMLLILMTLIGHLLSLIIFIKNKIIPWGGHSNMSGLLIILKKGFHLFIYNTCFFFIVLSTRSIISFYYSVEEFGLFTFSFTLANSILLFLQAVSTVLFPKILDKLHSNSEENIRMVLNKLNDNFVTLSYGLVFLAVIFFPIFLQFIPKYNNTLKELNLISITVLLFTNSFGYASFLMSKNKEKVLSIISLISLSSNIILSLVLTLLFNVTYEYVILATLVSYFIFSYLCTYFTRKFINEKTNLFQVLFDFFPTRLIVPYLILVVLIILKINSIIFIPGIIFLLLNRRQVLIIINSIKFILLKPNLIDIHK